MIVFKDIPIKKKLNLIIMFTCIVVLFFSSAIFIVKEVITLRRSMIENISVLAKMTAINSSASLAFQDQEAAEEILAALEAEPHIESACIYTNEGEIFATYPINDFGGNQLSPDPVYPGSDQPISSPDTEKNHYFRKDHLDIYKKIILDGETIGMVFLRSDLEELYSRLKLYAIVGIIIIMLSIMMAYLISSKVQRVISEPIINLKQTMKTVSKKNDYSLRVKKQSNDELGLLIDGFNEMLSQIQIETIERKLAVEALQESEEKYRTILESIEDGYFESSLTRAFTFVNDATCKILGYTMEQLLNISSRQYLDKENDDKITQIHDMIIKTEKSVRTFPFEIIKKDGTKRQIEASFSLIKSGDGQKIGMRGVIRDITERKFLESQLAQSQKLESIGQLAAGIAHEINTPTQYVGDNTHFFQDSFGDINKALNKYEELLKAVRDNKVTNDLLSELEEVIEETDVDYLREEIPVAIEQSLDGLERISKIVRAMKEFSHPGVEEKTAIDINRAIQSTITIAKNEWKYVSEVETHFDPDLPLVFCLPGEFNQVILNMIINATHAISDVVGKDSGKKGMIRISTRKDGDWAEIHVEDTGPGIPEQIRSKIFDPFFTTKEVGKGTGQGLAISHSVIADKHGGSIRFETEMRKGTTFITRIPLESKPENKMKEGDEKTNSLCG